MKNLDMDMSKDDFDDRGLQPSSSLSSHLSEEGGGTLKRSSSSRASMMSRCATAASLPLRFDPNADQQLSNKKKKSSAGLENSNRTSMPTFGVTTRSPSRKSSNQNEEWDCNKPRDALMNVFSKGLKKPPPPKLKPSLDGASQNDIDERLMDVRRSAPTGSIKTDPVSLTSSQPPQNFRNLPAMFFPVIESSIRNEETSRTRSLHRDVSAQSMPTIGVTTRYASRRSLNKNEEWECTKPQDSNGGSVRSPPKASHNRKNKSSASLRGQQCSNRPSMPTIGVTTRSAFHSSMNPNEEWDCTNPRDACMHVFSHGLTRPPPKPSLKSACHRDTDERLRIVKRTLTSSLTSSETTQNSDLPATPSPAAETSNRNEEFNETSRTQDLHTDVSAKSMPKFGLTQLSASLISSDENKEWDCCTNPRDVNMNIFPHGRIRSQPKPSLKSAINERPSDVKRSARRVTFYETQAVIYIDESDDTNMKWYSASDNDRFKNDATARAAIIVRTMQYVSRIENTYNSFTGLTAPHVLKEYLLSPEEIIGIECLFPSQQSAREWLKKHHNNALVNELRLMRQMACDDPLLLAERLSDRLRKSSDISVHMARERAKYITLLV